MLSTVLRKFSPQVYQVLNKNPFHVGTKLYQQSAISPDFYTDDHKQIRESLRKLIDQEINPYVDEWEDAELFPAHELFKKLGNQGIFGVNYPTEYGGLGLDFSYSMAVAEELGTINCGAIPMAIGVQMAMATPALNRFGSNKLKEEFLAPTIAGDYVTCLGVSEVGAGSDVANIETKAVPDGDDLIINGGKMWTTNGCQADWMCLLACTSEGPSHKNKSLICLPMNLPGVHVAKKLKKLGMKSSDTAQIFFEDVRIPRSYIIGEEGQGFIYQMLQFQEERLWAVAGVIGPLETVIQLTIEYTMQRKIFGESVLNNQSVHFKLAELQTELEMLKALFHKSVGISQNTSEEWISHETAVNCSGLYLQGHDVTKYASMCKLRTGQLSRQVIDSCLQFWGGMGYTEEVLISRFYRDFRLISIGGGTDEVMLSIICKYMNILPKMTKK